MPTRIYRYLTLDYDLRLDDSFFRKWIRSYFFHYFSFAFREYNFTHTSADEHGPRLLLVRAMFITRRGNSLLASDILLTLAWLLSTRGKRFQHKLDNFPSLCGISHKQVPVKYPLFTSTLVQGH